MVQMDIAMDGREFPIELKTPRLTLRSLCVHDVDALAMVAGERTVADTTISVPHPFGTTDAARLVERAGAEARSGSGYRLAVTGNETRELVGYIGLHDVDREHLQAEISFWIGDAWTGQGLVTEAARCIIAFAFDDLGLNRLAAFHMARNPASGRVLAKLGFKREGLLRQRVRKWDVFEDVVALALLRSDHAECLDSNLCDRSAAVV